MLTPDDLDRMGVAPEFQHLIQTDADTAEQDAELAKQAEEMKGFFHEPGRASAAGDALAARVEAEALAARFTGSEALAKAAVGDVLGHLDDGFERPLGVHGDLADFDAEMQKSAGEQLRKASSDDDAQLTDEEQKWVATFADPTLGKSMVAARRQIIAEVKAAVLGKLRGMEQLSKSLSSNGDESLPDRIAALREKLDASYSEYVAQNFNLVVE